jgi:IS1 family transposase
LEEDEFWTYVGTKSRKVWLIYSYHRDSGEIVAFAWGKRNLKTARTLKKKMADSAAVVTQALPPMNGIVFCEYIQGWKPSYREETYLWDRVE